MNKIGNQFSSIEQVADQYLTSAHSLDSARNKEVSFQKILEQKKADISGSPELRFSRHASMRLENRNISLSKEQRARLENGARQAKAKGIKDSLVLVDSLAFIVNIPNGTVVTAMEQGEAAENIYTNIDGAVII